MKVFNKKIKKSKLRAFLELLITFLCFLALTNFFILILSVITNSDNKTLTFISAFFSFLISGYLADKAGNFIDRFFYQKKAMLQTFLDEYNHAITNIFEKPALITITAAYLERIISPATYAIYLCQEENLYIKETTGTNYPAQINLKENISELKDSYGKVLFLNKNKKNHGLILLGPKQTGTGYTEDENMFLEQLASAFGVAVNTVGLTDEMLNIELKNIELNSRTKFLNSVAINLSHDLKSPLLNCYNIVYKINESAAEIKPDKAAITEYLEKLKKNLRKINNYIYTSLDRELIAAAKLKLKTEKININEACLESISMHKESIEQKNILFSFKSASGTAFALADKMRLEHVISNLLSNAVKFAESFISLNIETGFNSVLIKVYDDGKGISDEIMTRLFEKFTTTSENGTGLGLNICREYIKLMNGKISFENEDKGVTFTVELPLFKEEMGMNYEL